MARRLDTTSLAQSRTTSRIVRCIADVRERLANAYGWTWIDVRVVLASESPNLIALEGEVLVPRIRRSLANLVRRTMPRGCRVDVESIALLETRRWRSLPPGVTPLWRRRPGTYAPELATQLLAEDGPVELLVELDGAYVVRGMDGTVGWVDRPLCESAAPPRQGRRPAASAPAPEAFVAAARARLGVDYHLGGTTAAGIDCSGLVWRCLRESANIVVPRHSTDQLAMGPSVGPGLDQAGTLVFVWSSSEAPGHVGIASGAGTIIHASRSRGRVVEDPRQDYLAGAGRVRHVPWERIRNRDALALTHANPAATSVPSSRGRVRRLTSSRR